MVMKNIIISITLPTTIIGKIITIKTGITITHITIIMTIGMDITMIITMTMNISTGTIITLPSIGINISHININLADMIAKA